MHAGWDETQRGEATQTDQRYHRPHDFMLSASTGEEEEGEDV